MQNIAPECLQRSCGVRVNAELCDVQDKTYPNLVEVNRKLEMARKQIYPFNENNLMPTAMSISSATPSGPCFLSSL